jgi:quercetin dioxygenase-like cupin family protein
LIRDKNLTVVLTVLQAGASLQEHYAPASVTLLPLFGHIVLLTDAGRPSTELSPGTTGAFAAHLEHRVEATQDSGF